MAVALTLLLVGWFRYCFFCPSEGKLLGAKQNSFLSKLIIILVTVLPYLLPLLPLALPVRQIRCWSAGRQMGGQAQAQAKPGG